MRCISFCLVVVPAGTCEEFGWWTACIHHYIVRYRNCNSYACLLQESVAGENTWYATVHVSMIFI
jgi:hypothetical protein